MVRKVLWNQHRFPKQPLLSRRARDMVSRLLEKVPHERPTARRVLQEFRAWTQSDQQGTCHLDAAMLQSMDKFQSARPFKKMSLNIVAARMENQSLRELRSTFHRLDADGDGEVTEDELADAISEHDTGTSLASLFKSLDVDGSGKVSYSEFVAAAMQASTYQRRDVLWEIFNFFDRDGDGKIAQEELQQVFTSRAIMTETDAIKEEVCTMVRSADNDGDGLIDFNEFLAAMDSSDAGS